MAYMTARKLLVVAALLVLATSCAADDPPTESADSTTSAPTATHAPKNSTSAPPEKGTSVPSVPPAPSAEPDVVEPVLPEDLLGLWVSIDQGDAETIYRFVADGTYDQVSILMQARPGGTFSFTIQASGLVQIEGDRMVLTPTEGNEAMQDPDSPSSNFDRPLDDLSPEDLIWTIENGTLFLTGQYGTVAYEWTPEG
jgi:hypothetical protein